MTQSHQTGLSEVIGDEFKLVIAKVRSQRECHQQRG